MLQAQLDQAVSRATGESCDVIHGRGFSLVSDESPLLDTDFDALIEDWYEIQSEWSMSEYHEPMTLRSFAPESGIPTRVSKKARKSTAQYQRTIKPMSK